MSAAKDPPMEDRNERRDLAKKHGLTVLYEDNHLLVLEKPQNLPVQADASGDPDLLSIAKGICARRATNRARPISGLSTV